MEKRQTIYKAEEIKETNEMTLRITATPNDSLGYCPTIMTIKV